MVAGEQRLVVTGVSIPSSFMVEERRWGGFGGSPYLNKLAAAAAHIDGQFFFAVPARRGGGEERGGRSSGCMRSRCLSSLDPSFPRGWSRSLIQIRGSLSSAVAYVLKMENKQPRPGDDAGGPELHRQGIWEGNDVYRLPAFSDELPYILVERRPCFFSRPCRQRGGSAVPGWSPRHAAVEVSPDQVVPSLAPA